MNGGRRSASLALPRLDHCREPNRRRCFCATVWLSPATCRCRSSKWLAGGARIRGFNRESCAESVDSWRWSTASPLLLKGGVRGDIRDAGANAPGLRAEPAVGMSTHEKHPKEESHLLVSRYLQSRSSEDFSLLVHAYSEFVRAVAFQTTKRTDLAEDVSQEVFLRLLDSPPEPGGIRNERAYLAGMAYRTALMVQRSEKRRRVRERAAQHPNAQPVSPPTAVEMKRAMEAVLELPDDLRIPFCLHYLQGISVTDAGRIIGCHRVTVQRRIAKARKVLRQKIGAVLVASLIGGTGEAAAAPSPAEHGSPGGAEHGETAGGTSCGTQTLFTLGSFGSILLSWLGTVALLLIGIGALYFLSGDRGQSPADPAIGHLKRPQVPIAPNKAGLIGRMRMATEESETGSHQEAKPRIPGPLITVTNWETKRPVADVTFASRENKIESERTPDGKWRVALAEDADAIVAQSPGFFTTLFLLPTPLPAPFHLSLVPAGTHRVRVLNEETIQPIPGLRVQMGVEKRTTLSQTETDEEGRGQLRLPYLVLNIRKNPPDRAIAHTRFSLLFRGEGYGACKKFIPLRDFNTHGTDRIYTVNPVLNLDGLVVAPDNTPVPGARLYFLSGTCQGLHRSDTRASVESDAEGRFTWQGSTLTWQTVVLAFKQGYAFGVTSRLLPARNAEKIIVRLRTPCEFRGEFTTDSGRPAGGVNLALVPVNKPPDWMHTHKVLSDRYGKYPFQGSTDDNGLVRITNVPPGRYALVTTGGAWIVPPDNRKEIELPGDGVFSVSLAGGGELLVSVVAPGGEAVPDPTASVFIETGETFELVLGYGKDVTPSGDLSIHGLPQRPCVLRIGAEGYQSALLDVVPEGQEVEVVLEPRAGGTTNHVDLELSTPFGPYSASSLLVFKTEAGTKRYEMAFSKVTAGKTRITDLLPGAYDFSLSPNGFLPVVLTSVDVPRYSPLRVNLQPAPVSFAKIESTIEGLPPLLTIRTPEGQLLRYLRVSDDGDFLLPGLAEGTYRFEGVCKNGKRLLIWDSVLVTGEETLRLDATAAVRLGGECAALAARLEHVQVTGNMACRPLVVSIEEEE